MMPPLVLLRMQGYHRNIDTIIRKYLPELTSDERRAYKKAIQNEEEYRKAGFSIPLDNKVLAASEIKGIEIFLISTGETIMPHFNPMLIKMYPQFWDPSVPETLDKVNPGSTLSSQSVAYHQAMGDSPITLDTIYRK